MIKPSIANRLLPFCDEGPVLDLVASHVTSFNGSTAPSDQITRKLLKGASADEAEKIVAAISSPDLLLEITRKEKRLGVRRALAENAHLPLEAEELLVEDAVKRRDSKLAEALLEGCEPIGKLNLLHRRPQLRRLVSSRTVVTDAVLAHCHSEEADSLLERAVELFPEYALACLEKVVAWDTKVSPETILQVTLLVAEESILSAQYGSRLRGQISSQIAKARTDRATLERALEALPWAELRTSIVEASSRDGDLLVPQDVLFERVEDEAGAVTKVGISLSGKGHLLTRESASVLAEYPIPAERHQHLRCTPEGAEVFLAAENAAVAAMHLRDVPAERRVSCIQERPGELVPLLDLRYDEIWELHQHGLDEEHVWSLTKRTTRERFAPALTGPLRRLVLERGPEERIAGLELDLEELQVLLHRSDYQQVLPEKVQQAVVKLLKKTEVGDDVRREVMSRLSGARVAEWVSGTRLNRLTVEELKESLARMEQADREAVEAHIASAAIGWGAPEWTSVAVDLVALDWARVSSSHVLKRVHERLKEELGTDVEAWHTALALLPDWTGTFDELLDTVKMV